jgi:xanthine dehydrogenase accessory factor
MYFFIEPIREPGSFLPYAREALEACRGGSPVALATVVKAGPGSGGAGSRLLIRRDGTTLGSLGSQVLEEMARQAARRVAEYGRNEHLVAEDGTELFVEGFTTPPTLVMMGGGHIGKALASLARMVGFRIYVIDDRPQFASRERFPEADGVVVADFAEGLAQVPVNTNTFIVVATRGHRYDDLALEAALRSPARYVGLVGSRRKTILIHKELLKRGVPLERLREVHAPIGLDIGALTPEEIAVSIMAEMIMCRLGGTGRPMKLDERYLRKLEGEPWEEHQPSS